MPGHALAARDLPDALVFRIRVKPVARKYISSAFQKIMSYRRIPARLKRGGRVVTNARRDAMGAMTPRDERRHGMRQKRVVPISRR
jgi:hypothetical protein